MCFLPNNFASMDQAPGPIIARAAPRVACIVGIQGSPECEEKRASAIHNLTIVTMTPTSGVHNPAKTNNPAATPMLCRAAISNDGFCSRFAMP